MLSEEESKPTIGDIVWFWTCADVVINGARENSRSYYPNAAMVVGCNHELTSTLTLRVTTMDGNDFVVWGVRTGRGVGNVAKRLRTGEQFVVNGHWSPKRPETPFSELAKSGQPGIVTTAEAEMYCKEAVEMFGQPIKS